jgi:putative ABC transport system permease protein
MPLKHAVRRLLQFPLFTSVSVFTLAIGIGANCAIFAVVYGVLLKPLPYPDSGRLVAVDHAAPGVNIPRAGAAPFLYFTYRDQAKSFSGIGMYQSDTMSVTGLGEPEEIPAMDVTQGLLPTLGVKPALGRLFTQADDSPGSPETTILSYAYWRARFGGDASAVGRTVMFDGRPRQIVGVLPAAFRFLDRNISAFVPMQLDRSKTFLGQFSYEAIARLAPEATIQSASADLARLIPIAIETFPAFPGYSSKMFVEARLTPALRPLKDAIVGDVGGVLWVLMGTIGIVLLIACANVANLLLVRTDGRQQELAIRVALGAGWPRIARELMTESLILGVCGGIVGLGLAYGGVRLLIALAPANLPRLSDIAVGGPVLLFSLGVSIFAGALFGGVLIAKYARPRVSTELRAGGRTMSASRERQRVRNVLVVAQIALALVLLVGSGLMIRTFEALRHVQPGFTHPENVLTMRITIPSATVKEAPAVVRMQQAILDKIAAVPGVTSVGLASSIPMDGNHWTDPIYADDKQYAEGKLPPLRRFKLMSPGLLNTLGTPLVAGRDFTWDDVYQLHPVALVSENLARELWGSPSAAIGRSIRESMKTPWRRIIGVVADVRDDGVDQKAPESAYFPTFMHDFEGDAVSIRRTPAFVIRSSRAGSTGFLKDVSAAIWSMDPNLPLASVRTLQEIYDKSLARTSFALVMLSIAGAMALLLGIGGIYGVISYAVSQRRREIGIRVALGARPQQVTRLFVGQGLRLAAIGAAIGLVCAVALMRLMTSMLFGVSAVDPLTYAGVAVGLVGVALLACYVPAIRATAVSPVEALRAE